MRIRRGQRERQGTDYMLECSGQEETCGRGVDNWATVHSACGCRNEPLRRLAGAAIPLGIGFAPSGMEQPTDTVLLAVNTRARFTCKSDP